MTHLRCIALINYREFFPKTQTLIGKHLHKTVESPVIIDHSVTDTPLVPLLPGLMLFLRNDHLPLGKIAEWREKRLLPRGREEACQAYQSVAQGDGKTSSRRSNRG